MWVRKKDFVNLEARIAALEAHEESSMWGFGRVSIQTLAEKLPDYIDGRIALAVQEQRANKTATVSSSDVR